MLVMSGLAPIGGEERTAEAGRFVLPIAPNRIRNYADWLLDIAARGSASHVRMPSAEVIRSRAQPNRGGSKEQGTLTYRK